jgi:hypothetical protein
MLTSCRYISLTLHRALKSGVGTIIEPYEELENVAVVMQSTHNSHERSA